MDGCQEASGCMSQERGCGKKGDSGVVWSRAGEIGSRCFRLLPSLSPFLHLPRFDVSCVRVVVVVVDAVAVDDIKKSFQRGELWDPLELCQTRVANSCRGVAGLLSSSLLPFRKVSRASRRDIYPLELDEGGLPSLLPVAGIVERRSRRETSRHQGGHASP